MSEIALFPLSSILMPLGRMSLQIFEQRYLDLVARCMRENEGFGVIWLKQCSEVSGGSLDTPNVGRYGTYARIVDWDQLPNGLLGILIEGAHRFDVHSVWREHDGLIKGDTKSLAIAMGSMLAKVTRDRIMRNLHHQFPDLLQLPYFFYLKQPTHPTFHVAWNGSLHHPIHLCEWSSTPMPLMK